METQASTLEEIGAVLSLPAGLHIRLFGGTEITSNGVPLRRTRSRTETWLLAALLLRTNRSVERAWLAAIFWPESRPEMALNNLRRSLSNLRQVLGEESYRLLSPTQHTVAFDLAEAFCDVTAFDNALARKDAVSLRRAVELYRGPLLPGCFADWLLPERRAREQAFLATLETLAHQATQKGDLGEAVRFLRQVLEVEPLRETTQRALLEVLASSGDKAAMTLAYRQLRLLLRDQLQSEPSAETSVLYQQLQGRVSADRTPPPVPPHTPAAGNHSTSAPMTPPLRIPWPVSELIGREAATEEVATLLLRNRLVTLTGSGGIGKTRLALSVAAHTSSGFPEGVWFVDLSSVTDPEQVLIAVTRVLEMREPKGLISLPNALREHLWGKRLLLVLDNAEHLNEVCAILLANLLESLPRLQALVTSRMPLGIAGERVWRVPSLPFPNPSTVESRPLMDSLLDFAGPRLFVTRALSASSAFVLTERNAPAIVRICARLDGIPLALELAAARVASLSAEQISTLLEDSFRLLTTGVRTALPRHRTLQALVDWSYDLLTPGDKTLLARLSVFAGSWTLEAAENICGFAPLEGIEVLDLLTSLVDKSLVLAEEVGETMRYRMLETLRQYGVTRLKERGETVEVRRRHRDYFRMLAEEINPKLRGSEQAYFLWVLETEHDNLRAALAFSLEDATGGEAGLGLGVALQRFWGIRGHLSEGREYLTALLSHPGAQARTKTRADALRSTGVMVAMQADYSSARSFYEESLAIFRELGDRNGIATSLNGLGNAIRERGDYISARALYEESLAIFRGLGDRSGIAYCLGNLGAAALEQGDYESARSLYSESLAIFREVGDKNSIAYCLGNLGVVSREQGDYASARSLYEESLTIFRELGDWSGISGSLNNLGNVARHQGDYASARALYEESLGLRREIGNKDGIAASLNSQGNAAYDQGDYESARSLYLESLAIFREVGDRIGIAYSLNGLGNVARHQGDYASASTQYEEGMVIFREIGDRSGIAESLRDMGNAALEQSDYESARFLYSESLTIFRELGDRRRIARTLQALAFLAAKEGRAELSVELWGATAALRDALRTPPPPLERERGREALAALWASLGEAAYTAAWEVGSTMTWEQAVAYALDRSNGVGKTAVQQIVCKFKVPTSQNSAILQTE